MTITLTDMAADRIKALTGDGEHAGQILRLAVNAGGCSGFEYKFSFATAPDHDDQIFTHDGAQLLVDKFSLPLLVGATLDYKQSLMSAQFEVINPLAASGCGCGNSFSLKDA